MKTKRSFDEIKDSILRKRELMEQTNYSSKKFDSMYEVANNSFDELEYLVYSTIK